MIDVKVEHFFHEDFCFLQNTIQEEQTSPMKAIKIEPQWSTKIRSSPRIESYANHSTNSYVYSYFMSVCLYISSHQRRLLKGKMQEKKEKTFFIELRVRTGYRQ